MLYEVITGGHDRLAHVAGHVALQGLRAEDAAFTPGTILALMYASYVLGRCLLNPELAPRMPVVSPEERKHQRIEAIKSVVMPAAIAFMVLGTIYAGVASVTEAASMGVLGVLLATAIRRVV